MGDARLDWLPARFTPMVPAYFDPATGGWVTENPDGMFEQMGWIMEAPEPFGDHVRLFVDAAGMVRSEPADPAPDVTVGAP